MRKMKKMKQVRLVAVSIAAVPAVLFPAISPAQTIYSDNFNSAADSANYNIIQTTATGGAPSSDATFGYDYSALGIPVAPDTTDSSTLGLRLRVDNLANSITPAAVGAIEVATVGLTLPSRYVITFDLWGNYIGSGTSIASSGSNGSTAPGVGVGTSGTSLQSPNANDGFIADTFHDGGGGANADYRIYLDNTARPVPSTSPYWAAGQTSTAGSHSDAYYSFLSPQSAPSAESTVSSTQGGSTPAGIVGFQWTKWTITQDGTNLTWAINGHTVTTVPDSSITFGGNQVSLDSIDSGLTGNTAANNQTLNFDIFDNLNIMAVPEPSMMSLLAVGVAGLLARRLKK
jgi:hypothetical protein